MSITFQEFKDRKPIKDSVLNAIVNNVVKISKFYYCQTSTEAKANLQHYIDKGDYRDALIDICCKTLEEDKSRINRFAGERFQTLLSHEAFEEYIQAICTTIRNEIHTALGENLLPESITDSEKKTFYLKANKVMDYLSTLYRNIESILYHLSEVPENAIKVYYPLDVMTVIYAIVVDGTYTDREELIRDAKDKPYRQFIDNFFIDWREFIKTRSNIIARR